MRNAKRSHCPPGRSTTIRGQPSPVKTCANPMLRVDDMYCDDICDDNAVVTLALPNPEYVQDFVSEVMGEMALKIRTGLLPGFFLPSFLPGFFLPSFQGSSFLSFFLPGFFLPFFLPGFSSFLLEFSLPSRVLRIF